MISREFIVSVILTISCSINGSNLRPNIKIDTGTKKPKQELNFKFEI